MFTVTFMIYDHPCSLVTDKDTIVNLYSSVLNHSTMRPVVSRIHVYYNGVEMSPLNGFQLSAHEEAEA